MKIDDEADKVALEAFQEVEFILTNHIANLINLGKKESNGLDGIGVVVHTSNLDAFKLLTIQQKNKVLDLIEKRKANSDGTE